MIITMRTPTRITRYNTEQDNIVYTGQWLQVVSVCGTTCSDLGAPADIDSCLDHIELTIKSVFEDPRAIGGYVDLRQHYSTEIDDGE